MESEKCQTASQKKTPSFSSMGSKTVSLSLSEESPDEPPLPAKSPEIGRMSARALERAACVNTGMAKRSEGTRRALKRMRQCIST